MSREFRGYGYSSLLKLQKVGWCVFISSLSIKKFCILCLQQYKVICTLINIFCSSLIFSIPGKLPPVLQQPVCYWLGIDFGIICCPFPQHSPTHPKSHSYTKLSDIRTAGNVTFVNVFNHIFNKTPDAFHKDHFLLPAKYARSVYMLQIEAESTQEGG